MNSVIRLLGTCEMEPSFMHGWIWNLVQNDSNAMFFLQRIVFVPWNIQGVPNPAKASYTKMSPKQTRLPLVKTQVTGIHARNTAFIE